MDFILHESAALSKEWCDQYVELFEANPQSQHDGGMHDNQGIVINNPEWKKCKEIYLEEYRFFEPIEPCMSESILKYREKYPSVDVVHTWDIEPTFKLQRYLPSEAYFKVHCENASPEDSNRVLAWMIYLNDVYDEGHTVFPNQEKKFQPRTGDLLIWPAHFTHPHHGVPSKTETKYILTGWFSFKE